MTDIEEQGKGNGKGRGPPEKPGPRGPPDFAGPAGDMPDHVPDHVDEEVHSKPEKNSQGRLGMQVIDKDGNVKQAVEYARVSGEGSVELQARNDEVEDGVKWLKTRRDRLPRRKNKGSEE